MALIPKDWGIGDSAHHDSHGGATRPSLATAMRDVADDLAGLQPATLVEADATDLATAITLVNEIKASVNGPAAITISTTKGT